MQRRMKSLVCWTVAAVLVWGCGKAADTSKSKTDSKSAANTSTTSDEHASLDHDSLTVYCGKCGEVKGSDKCCAADAEKCSCGMIKGSPLCCVKLSEDAKGKDLCGKCGHVHSADHRCDADCETCECGLHKDSELCCKLNKT